MPDSPAPDPAAHAVEFSRRWTDRLEQYVAIRMEELGIPEDKIGAPDLERGGRWRAFDPEGMTGGSLTKGVYLDSGIFNPDLLDGSKCEQVWAGARLRDRIDAIIAHEWEESKLVDHLLAIEAAPTTELPITDGARRILEAMAR